VITVVEPKPHITQLWGQQRIDEGQIYRLMKYVLRVNHKGKVLFHNMVTGQLVILSQEESSIINELTFNYSPILKALIENRFLVPISYDEHAQVKELRNILQKLNDKWAPKKIHKYTILPTTTCNARCYYCFEQGAKVSTMTSKVAEDVVRFIKDHYCKGDQIVILWFGGEPTVASNRIDEICTGLERYRIDFTSRMMSNGYLFGNEMVHRAKELWRLRSVKICIDGTEKFYNKIKAYVNVQDNPYQRVMQNVGYLLAEGICVDIRMNFDIQNAEMFKPMLEDVILQLGKNPLLTVSAHPIIGEYRNSDGEVVHGSDQWLEKKALELNDTAREAGLYPITARIPCLSYKGCSAARDSAVTITPEGNIVRCLEQYGCDQITGNIYDGVLNKTLVQSWKEFADYERCSECIMFPVCDRLKRCATYDKCYYSLEYMRQYTEVIKKEYQKKESEIYDNGRTQSRIC